MRQYKYELRQNGKLVKLVVGYNKQEVARQALDCFSLYIKNDRTTINDHLGRTITEDQLLIDAEQNIIQSYYNWP